MSNLNTEWNDTCTTIRYTQLYNYVKIWCFSYPVYKRCLCTCLYLVIHTCLRSRMLLAVRFSPLWYISSRGLPPLRKNPHVRMKTVCLMELCSRSLLIERTLAFVSSKSRKWGRIELMRIRAFGTIKRICSTSNSNSRRIIAGERVRGQTSFVPTWSRTKAVFRTKSGWRSRLKVRCWIVVSGNACTTQSSKAWTHFSIESHRIDSICKKVT